MAQIPPLRSCPSCMSNTLITLQLPFIARFWGCRLHMTPAGPASSPQRDHHHGTGSSRARKGPCCCASSPDSDPLTNGLPGTRGDMKGRLRVLQVEDSESDAE